MVMLTHEAGAASTARESNVSFHGSGGNTRTFAVPVTPSTVAFTQPAWLIASLATVSWPFVTVPLSWSNDQVAAGSSRMKLPCASKSRARKLILSPGFRISSVGTTCTCVTGFELTLLPTANEALGAELLLLVDFFPIA